MNGLSLALALVVLGSLAACESVPVRREPPPVAQEQPKPVAPTAPPTMTMCQSPVSTVIVIEAQPDGGGKGGMGGMSGMGGMMGGMQADPYARLDVPPLAQIARRIADKSGCFNTLESDPALLAMPGGVQPEVVLRVRASSIRVVERSLAEKATGAAKRYIGRYTGATETDPDMLQAAEVTLELVCPKQRRVLQSFKGMADAPLGEPTLTGARLDTVPGANHERLAMAYAKAQDAALLFLRAKPKPCD